MRGRSRLARGVLILSLALGTFGISAVGQAQPAGACNGFWTYATYNVPDRYSVPAANKSSGPCQDLNVAYSGTYSCIKGWWNNGSDWVAGWVGWVCPNSPGWFDPWIVLVSSVYTGTPLTMTASWSYNSNVYWVI
jgi:hypothetical protein